jgi:large subunit ribosomal protein L22
MVTAKETTKKKEVMEEKKVEETKTEDKKMETQKEEKSQKKEQPKVELKPKEVAIARAISARASLKYGMGICKMIKGKTPKRAIEMLEEVLKMKRAVPFRSLEVGHRSGMGGGKYPLNAVKVYIPVVKQLEANANTCGIENPVIVIAKTNKAPRPMRKGGTEGKRVHIHLEAKSKEKLAGGKK